MSNYPDGMRESDIPGWDDEDITIDALCECGFTGRVDAVAGCDGIEWTCPDCGEENFDEQPEPDWDDIAEQREEARLARYDDIF